MNRIIPLAVLAITWIAVDCSAAPPEGKGKGAREGGPRAGQREGAQRGQRRGGDPAQMVARMMQEFDKDGDQKLDATELTALLTSLRERRMAGGGAGRRGQAGADGAGKMRQRPGGERKRKQGAGGNNTPGGEKPKRPVAE